MQKKPGKLKSQIHIHFFATYVFFEMSIMILFSEKTLLKQSEQVAFGVSELKVAITYDIAIARPGAKRSSKYDKVNGKL